MIHGGQLSKIAEQYNIPETEWIDLSTGIAPFSYPVQCLPDHVWQNLPNVSTSLLTTARLYYQADYCWPLAGSQNLIEKLPMLWRQKCHPLLNRHVYLPKVGYKEHQQAWSNAGYQLHFYQQTLPTNIENNSVVVVINPNNPLTDVFSITQLKQLQQHCHQQQALLIIDEAFADIYDKAFSFVPQLNKVAITDTLILRSFGKFFGLAGLRVGFVCCQQAWYELIKENTGPWSVNGPALYITEQALQDKAWQAKQTLRLQQHSQSLKNLLAIYFPDARIEANALFITLFVDNAEVIYDQLCRKAVYVRLTDEKNALRFGIATEQQLIQLEKIMAKINLG